MEPIITRILVRNRDGTTTEYRLAEGAIAVEVQKDDRALVTVDVSDPPQLAAKGEEKKSPHESLAVAQFRIEKETKLHGFQELKIVANQVDGCDLKVSADGSRGQDMRIARLCS